MAQFRKKPVVIEAIQLSSSPGAHGNQIKEWKDIERMFSGCDAIGNRVNGEFEALLIKIPTLEGDMYASPGDWIVTGVKGEFYPCKPDIFEATYEAAD